MSFYLHPWRYKHKHEDPQPPLTNKTTCREPASIEFASLKRVGVNLRRFWHLQLDGSRRPPNGSRHSQRVALVKNLNCRKVLDGSRTAQRVAHLLQRVAPLSTARKCCSLTPFSLSLSQFLLHNESERRECGLL